MEDTAPRARCYPLLYGPQGACMEQKSMHYQIWLGKATDCPSVVYLC